MYQVFTSVTEILASEINGVRIGVQVAGVSLAWGKSFIHATPER